MIRTCSLDNGSGLIDREIKRASHCGYLILKNFDVHTGLEDLFYGKYLDFS